jgi:hypothetical protein
MRELPQFKITQMEFFLWRKERRLRQRVARGRKIITPHTGSFLTQKEGRIYEKVTSNNVNVVWS